MQILALELSTTQAEAAILRDGAPCARQAWTQGPGRPSGLVDALSRLFTESGCAPAALDACAVGLGPGIFSGLRASLAALHALMLPDGRPVYGVSSGEALAQQLYESTRRSWITVIGDARRERLWYGVFTFEGGQAVQKVPYSLTPVTDLPTVLRPGTLVATADWDRLGAALEDLNLPAASLAAGAHYPTAAAVGQRVLAQLKAGRAQPARSAIYMHPPVFVPPRYPVPPPPQNA